MSVHAVLCRIAALAVCGALPGSTTAQDQPPASVSEISITNSHALVRVTPYPAAEEYQLLRADNVRGPFISDGSAVRSGYEWKTPFLATDTVGFYRVRVKPISENDLFTGTVLNRLAHGPTPDDLERVLAMGPEAFILEQLAPESIPDNLDWSRDSTSDWQYVWTTGTGSSGLLYISLALPGEGYIDDIRVVTGTDPEVGTNLLRNGDFEQDLNADEWVVGANLAQSKIATNISHSGTKSLHLIATSSGTTLAGSIYQTNLPRHSSTRYSLSCWFLPATNAPVNVNVRLAGNTASASSSINTSFRRLTAGTATLRELQLYCLSHAVRSKRQLLEMLTQFFDNHFTTYQPKSQDFLTGKAAAGTEESIATEMEYRERRKWRDVLLNPNGTFYDLLKISAESPAMVVYLDTVTSTNKAPNENYARELMELFTMGADNGYDQSDIEAMSRAWTGWQVDKLPWGREDDPFATPVSNKASGQGYWTLRFRSSYHDPEAKSIFGGKKADTRFGPPWAGRPYELNLPARADNDGMQDGYDIIAHLANLPYTQEFISVKLCRFFVHERFVHGTYDYADPKLSPEAALVRDCMAAWERPGADGRKGNLRDVLGVIFHSDLFRRHGASQQKVKSPLQFVVSAVRAIRAAKPDGGFTSESGGSELLEPMSRIGMNLFFREQPDGWSEFGADWINSSSLIERIHFAQARMNVGNNASDPVALLKLKVPPAKWRDAESVVDYFLRILFPAEGRANLELDRAAAVNYLNTLEDGLSTSPFTELDPDSVTYQARVRAVVACLLGSPRFQEK